MKKKLLTLLLALSTLLVSASAEMILISPNPFAKDPWGVTMTVKDVTATGATVVFSQSGSMPAGELTTGEPYHLETLVNGIWEPMEVFDGIAWIMPAYPLSAGGSRDFTVNWSYICGQLPVGTYRIGKSVMLFRGPGDYDNKTYYAEFTIAPEDTTAQPLPFSDVPFGSACYDAVQYVYEQGLMQGKTDTLFAPEASMTRGQLVTALWRMENCPVVNYILFPDVAQDAYYAEAIRWAAGETIVVGYADGTFRPDAPLSRQQLTAILWRYAKYRGMDVSVGEDTNILSYNDAFDVSEYAIPAFQWACGAGVLCGHEWGDLQPVAIVPRADAARMLTNLLQNN